MIWTDEWIAIEAHRVAFLANGREAVAKIGMTMIRNELQAEIVRLTAERDDLAGKLEAAQAEIEELSNRLTEAQRATIEASNAGIKLLAEAHQELHDLRIRAGLGEFDPDEPVIINCPQCGAEHVDMDGFGVVYCEACKYCVHPQTDGGVCGICGQEAN